MRILLKTSAIALALLLPATGAHAQTSPYGEPECVADLSVLDTNKDGFIDNNESESYSDVRTNIDTNDDGMISAEEMTVACRDDSIVNALKSKR